MHLREENEAHHRAGSGSSISQVILLFNVTSIDIPDWIIGLSIMNLLHRRSYLQLISSLLGKREVIACCMLQFCQASRLAWPSFY